MESKAGLEKLRIEREEKIKAVNAIRCEQQYGIVKAQIDMAINNGQHKVWIENCNLYYLNYQRLKRDGFKPSYHYIINATLIKW